MKLLDEAGLTKLVKDLKRDVGDRVKATYNQTDQELTFTALNGDYLTVPVKQFDIDLVYPVGSIYITVSNDDPATLFGKGTWEIVGNGRVLWGVGASDTAGTTLSQQLPNIKGSLGNNFEVDQYPSESGALYKHGQRMGGEGNGNYRYTGIAFDASRSNSVYKDGAVVRPNAFTVKFWRRTA